MFPRHGRFLVILCGLFVLSVLFYWRGLPLVEERNRQFTNNVERRMELLRGRIHENERLIGELRRQLNDERRRLKNSTIDKPPVKEEHKRLPILRPIGNKTQDDKQALGSILCPAHDLVHNISTDVQMLSVYELLPFDDPDGGVWKQGWDIRYDVSKVQAEGQLEVFVVPHSHNDPGWLKTFEEYYSDDTRNIFVNMHKHLELKPDMKFIYAEMSFFELWWSEISEEIRAKISKEMAERGQLEIVTGGWVMTDEANANYFSMIMELIEGHEFLQNHLGVTPKNHWSIDSFGLSATMPYLLNRANFSHMAINRVHYAVKKQLAQRRQLEFNWRPLFAKNADTDIVANMFPFFSYDVPHTCGPDPKICCQFDFRRLKAYGCPWGRPPTVITVENVAERAQLLADQYRKKAQLYRANTLLVPLGDDFRYNTDDEWTDQYENYRRLMDFINDKRELNMRVQFGTLDNYFNATRSRFVASPPSGVAPVLYDRLLPTLTGDFFTYADRNDHYWSGYYTSRPFYKHMDRTLQHYMRHFNLAHARSIVNGNAGGDDVSFVEYFDDLVEARRALSLFQHHDGVTGTGRALVVEDYGQKMLNAINKCKVIIADSARRLTKRSDAFKVSEEHFHDALPRRIAYLNGKKIVLFNSLAHAVDEVVCVEVRSARMRVKTTGKVDMLQQIGPILYIEDDKIRVYDDKFELCFRVELAPLGFGRYDLFESSNQSHKVSVETKVSLYMSEFKVSQPLTSANVYLSNTRLNAFINAGTGLLKSVQANGHQFDVEMSFVTYKPRFKKSHKLGDSQSGAYLFLPNGSAQTLPTNDHEFVLVKGPVRQYMFLKGSSTHKVTQTIALDNGAAALSIVNHVDLANLKENVELAMRLKITMSLSDEKFFTDLNNFQMIRRRRFNKLPIQAQFYPMAGAAILENHQRRLTLLSRQALGVSSLEPGMLDVMLDRRLDSDDDRGLGEGVLDNRRTASHFRLLIEQLRFSPSIKGAEDNDKETIGYHSLAANHAQQTLHYPPVVMMTTDFRRSDVNEESSGVTSIVAAEDIACDLHLVALRTLSRPTSYGDGSETSPTRRTRPANAMALILHRFGTDCRFLDNEVCQFAKSNYGEVDLSGIARSFGVKSVQNVSLTLLHKSPAVTLTGSSTKLILDPMEIRTFQLNI